MQLFSNLSQIQTCQLRSVIRIRQLKFILSTSEHLPTDVRQEADIGLRRFIQHSVELEGFPNVHDDVIIVADSHCREQLSVRSGFPFAKGPIWQMQPACQ